MKKITLLILAVLAISTASAGNNNRPKVSFGVKFGVGIDDAAVTPRYIYSFIGGPQFPGSEKYTSYEGCILMRLASQKSPLYFQPEIIYNWGRLKNNDELGNVSLGYLKMPLMIGAGLKIGSNAKLRANVGPVFTLFSYGKTEKHPWHNSEEAFKMPIITWTAGIGFDIFGVMLDIRYSRIFKEREFALLNSSGGSVLVDYEYSAWTFSIGYMF